MSTIETQRDQLKAYEEYIESIKLKFDTSKKIEFKRRETGYYAAQRATKILTGELNDLEKELTKSVNVQNIFALVFFVLFGIATAFLSTPLLIFMAVGLIIGYMNSSNRINECRMLRATTLQQILFYDTEINKALSGCYLRYKDEADAIERNESFRNSLESEEIMLIQDLYEKEVQVAIINEMAE
jgi:hypothetical protein